MSGSYPRTENEAFDKTTANSQDRINRQIEALGRVVWVDGHAIGSYTNVARATFGEDTSAHHVTQAQSVLGIPGYKKAQAITISLTDRSLGKGTEHWAATQVQRREGGNVSNLGEAKKVGRRALKSAVKYGLSRKAAKVAIAKDKMYWSILGHSDKITADPVWKRRKSRK